MVLYSGIPATDTRLWAATTHNHCPGLRIPEATPAWNTSTTTWFARPTQMKLFEIYALTSMITRRTEKGRRKIKTTTHKPYKAFPHEIKDAIRVRGMCPGARLRVKEELAVRAELLRRLMIWKNVRFFLWDFPMCGDINHVWDHHNGESEASRQRPALSALKSDPRSIFAPPYLCLSLVYLFFCLDRKSVV